MSFDANSQNNHSFKWSFGALPGDSEEPPGLTEADRSARQQRRTQSELGRLAERFSVVGELGRGGMGVVYHARDRGGRDVALKVISGRMNDAQRARFRREGELTALLQHSGIVRIHDGGEHYGTPFLAYELIEGGQSFDDACANLDREGRLRLLHQVAVALGYAHSKGVVHRDVKPANVLVDPSGRSRVADFGLAWTEDAERLTKTGAFVGTPTYMAPEQFLGAKHEDLAPVADVWALGVMLFEALTDTSPFGGTTLLELAAQVRSGELPSLRGIDKTISKEIEAVCRVALSKDPAQRYPSATEFAADILASLDGGAVAAFGRQRRAARTRRLVVALSVLALLVAVSAGVLFANRQTEEALPRVRVMPPVERELAAARGFAAQGRIDDAADAYRRALALAPANAVVVEWARAALNSGSVSGAQRALEAFRGDDDSAALELRFRVRVELGDEAGAQALLARFPEGPLRQVRSAALAPLRHEDPAQVYQEAIGTWPEAPVLREELARYQWLERLEPALARRTLRLAWAKGAPSPGSNAILKSMRADAATVPSPNRDLALAFLGRGRRELQMIRRLDDARFRVSAKAPTRDERVARAAEALSHALRLSVPGSRCEALVRSALAALEGTDSEHLDRAWGLLGDHPPTRRLVAARLRARAETGWEQRVLELLATDPHPGARLLVGYAHLSLGEMLEALAPFKQAAGQNRAWVPACVGWAGALDGLGRNEEAKALRERVVLLEHPETEAADQALEKVLKQEDLRRLQPAAMRRAVAERVFVHDPIHPYGRFAVCAREFLGRQRGDLVPLGRAASQSLDVLARLQRSAFGLSDRSAIGRGGDRTVSRLRAYAQTPLAADASAPEFLVHGAMGAWAMEFEQQSALSNSVLWDLGRVLRRDPGETVAYVLRGFVHLRAGHLDQAASDLEIAAEQAPDCSVLVFYQALLAGAKRERAEVVLAYLLRARELNWRVWGESGWRHGAYPELERYSDRRDFKAFWNQVE